MSGRTEPDDELDELDVLVSIIFDQWQEVPALTKFDNLNDLRKAYRSQSGENLWFHQGTMEFFGSENLHVRQPGITIETQTKAPFGVAMYVVTAWVVIDGRISPKLIYRFDTLYEAQSFSDHLYSKWI
jgi:hypothetical protein